MSLSCCADTKTPTRWKKLAACWPPVHINPRLAGTKRLMAEIPETSLFPHHQPIRELGMSWSCTLCLSPLNVFQNPSWKAIEELMSFAHKLPILLVWCPAVNIVLSFTTAPSVDQLLPETVYDSMHGVSPTSEDHLGFGVQRFYWGLVT